MAVTSESLTLRWSFKVAFLALCLIALPLQARAKDKLLDETIEFTGAVLFLESKVPALVIGAVRNGEMSVAGFGKIGPKERAPDGNTIMRIGSITKVFTGAILASLVSEGAIKLADPLQSRLGWNVKLPTKDGHSIRLIDLATHTSGLPREVERSPAPADNPFGTITKEAFIRNLQDNPLLFAPGTVGFIRILGLTSWLRRYEYRQQAVRGLVTRSSANAGWIEIDGFRSWH